MSEHNRKQNTAAGSSGANFNNDGFQDEPMDEGTADMTQYDPRYYGPPYTASTGNVRMIQPEDATWPIMPWDSNLPTNTSQPQKFVLNTPNLYQITSDDIEYHEQTPVGLERRIVRLEERLAQVEERLADGYGTQRRAERTAPPAKQAPDKAQQGFGHAMNTRSTLRETFDARTNQQPSPEDPLDQYKTHIISELNLSPETQTNLRAFLDNRGWPTAWSSLDVIQKCRDAKDWQWSPKDTQILVALCDTFSLSFEDVSSYFFIGMRPGQCESMYEASAGD